MAISQNKKISEGKRLFLALCMIGGSVGADTVKLLKEDFGSDYIKKDIVYQLSKKGFILKAGYKSNYRYVLTHDGFDFLQKKCPDMYDYDCYKSMYSLQNKDKLQYRNNRLSLLLYTFYRNGIEFGSRYGDACSIMNGISRVYVEKPFFITAKEMRTINKRLAVTVGSRFYGCLFTNDGITVVYSPDEEHQLNAGYEKKFYGFLTTNLKLSYAPYNEPQNLSELFIFKNSSDMISQFTVKPSQTNKRSTSTKRVLLKNQYNYNYAYMLDNNAYHLSDILCKYNKDEIDRVFYEYYYLDSYKYTPDTAFVDGVYTDENFEDGILTILLWDLNPSKLAIMSRYIQENNRKMLICCFKEQIPLIQSILKINRKVYSHTLIAGLPKGDVYKYLKGEIDEID